MSKHTPGPWTIGGKEYSSHGDTIILGPNDGGYHGRRIAAVEMRRNTEGSPVHEVTDANARLIAAAPELLATMKAVLDDYRRPDWRNLKKNIAAMEAAIAKAEGK